MIGTVKTSRAFIRHYPARMLGTTYFRHTVLNSSEERAIPPVFNHFENKMILLSNLLG